MKTKINEFSHSKMVLAGFLTTQSLVRSTAEILYTKVKYPTDSGRQRAIMAYLHSLGLPSKISFDQLSGLFDTVFPKTKSDFPINLDYDQDNCDYCALLAAAASLDTPDSDD